MLAVAAVQLALQVVVVLAELAVVEQDKVAQHQQLQVLQIQVEVAVVPLIMAVIVVQADQA